MENTQEPPYQDSPSSSQSSTPLSSNRPLAKPLPTLPLNTPTEPLEPYRDEPSPTYEPSPTSPAPAPVLDNASQTPQLHQASSSTSSTRFQSAEIQLFLTPYTDAPRSANDDDVPLAQLYPYPTEAPPPYQVAVRESFRETLVQHLPSRSISLGPDEEAGIERGSADDVRFTVEKAVAAIIVSMLLLVIASLLALIAISGFSWKW